MRQIALSTDLTTPADVVTKDAAVVDYETRPVNQAIEQSLQDQQVKVSLYNIAGVSLASK